MARDIRPTSCCLSTYILMPFSFLYSLVIFLRDFLYRIYVFKGYRPEAKVISIGNITWGGTGKTPAVIYIARVLNRKHKLAILTRGYGDDEEKLFSIWAPEIPVLTGKDRVKSARNAIAEFHIDTLLLDDGFQHRRLERDLDIVCIDATNPFGNGYLIPAGILREGLSSLKRANIFLITKVDLVAEGKLKVLEERLKNINPLAVIVKSVHRFKHLYKLYNNQLVDIRYLKGRRIILVSAIGDPRSFEKTVSRLDIDIQRHFIYRDHHWFSEKDLKKITDYCRDNKLNTIIITEKDAVRFSSIRKPDGSVDILVLSIELELIENEEFNTRLFGIYNN